MGATVSEIAGGVRSTPPPPLVKGVSTKKLGKGRVNAGFQFQIILHYRQKISYGVNQNLLQQYRLVFVRRHVRYQFSLYNMYNMIYDI